MYQKILVAIDGSQTSARALSAAIELARDAGARLQALYVVDIPLMFYDVPGYDPSYVLGVLRQEGQQVLAGAAALMGKAGVQGPTCMVETELMGGENIAHRIRRAAQEFDADLVVMGTHGRRGVRRLMLGSVAERTLRIATCPMLLIPGHCASPCATPAKAAGASVDEPS
jgi:nucleotide-binding universal stress UspA family protein